MSSTDLSYRSYSRARVLLGMVNAGFWVLGAAIAIAFDGLRYAAMMEATHSPAVVLGEFLLLYVILSAPFDYLGGYVLPRRYGRSDIPFWHWVAQWCRAVVLHTAFMFLTGMALLYSAMFLGIPGAAAVLGLLMLLLSHFQLQVAQLLAPMEQCATPPLREGDIQLPGMDVVFVESEDDAFSGGISGRPGREQIVLPMRWYRSLSAEAFSVLKARRAGAILTSSRTRGLLVAIAWNVLWFAVAALLSSRPLHTAAGLLETACWFSMFTCLGMLGLLPELSRRAAAELDGWARDKGAPLPRLQQVISHTARAHGDHPRRSRLQEFIFHPVPSVENRLQDLLLCRRKHGAWHAARTMVFLSWAGLGLLSRAVHCNIGRPELWVFPPCD